MFARRTRSTVLVACIVTLLVVLLPLQALAADRYLAVIRINPYNPATSSSASFPHYTGVNLNCSGGGYGLDWVSSFSLNGFTINYNWTIVDLFVDADGSGLGHVATGNFWIQDNTGNPGYNAYTNNNYAYSHFGPGEYGLFFDMSGTSQYYGDTSRAPVHFFSVAGGADNPGYGEGQAFDYYGHLDKEAYLYDPNLASASFSDVNSSTSFSYSIGQLALRNIARGQGGSFSPNNQVNRAQMAAFIARSMGWDTDTSNGASCFPDLATSGIDMSLRYNICTLQAHGVVQGYQDGTYDPLGNVLKVQTIAFISRSMVAKGYWAAQPDKAQLNPNIPASSGHRGDIATYHHYALTNLDVFPFDNWNAWADATSRSWFSAAQWKALSIVELQDQP